MRGILPFAVASRKMSAVSAAQPLEKVVYLNFLRRPHQQAVHDALAKHRFACVVMHRRAGKTAGALSELVEGALGAKRPASRFGYLAPSYQQAKRIAWDSEWGIKRFTAPIPGMGYHETELRVDFPNGSRIQLGGAENIDAWRGVYWDGVVIDEPAQIDKRFWPEIIRPALSDRGGWALFIGTPQGEDYFYDLFSNARAGQDPEWSALLYRWNDTNILPASEIDSARRNMSEEAFAREYECSFTAGVEGAYYARLMDEVDRQGRVMNVRYDPRYPVRTAWDLGYGDATAIWMAQTVGNEVRLLRYIQDRGQPLRFYHEQLAKTGYSIIQDILPHDAGAHELGTGQSREETLRSLGRNPRVLPIVKKDDQIEAVRNLIPRCVFDAEGTALGRKALRHYRVDTNRRTGEGRLPLHDQWSHGADAFAQLAVGLRYASLVKKPRRVPDVRWIT